MGLIRRVAKSRKKLSEAAQEHARREQRIGDGQDPESMLPEKMTYGRNGVENARDSERGKSERDKKNERAWRLQPSFAEQCHIPPSEAGAFSSEVGTGSREENASKQ
jgi:hypothetical protein